MCWTLFEVATIIGNALFTALINDTVPKVMIGRFFGVFRIFSLGVGAYFYFFVFTNDIMKIHHEVLLAIGAVYVLGFAVLCAFVKEGEYPPPPPRSTEGVATNIGRYLQRCFANRFYLLLFAVFGLASTAIYVFNVNALPAKDQFGLDKGGYGKALAITYVISMTLAFPIGWLTDRFTPVLMGLITTALYTLVMIGAFFGIHDPLTFQIYFVAHGVLSGAFYTCTAALLLVLLPHGRFSEYASASAALTAVLQVIFSLLVGQAINMTVGFTADGAKDYRLIFLVAGGMSLIAALGWWSLWKRFQAKGGRLGYQADET